MAKQKTAAAAAVPPQSTAPSAPPRNLGPVQPRLNWKGNETFRHDLFKLTPAFMKKNTSYKKYEPQIQEVEHSHFFHSHDKKGTKMEFCQPVGNHFHRVIVAVDGDGNITAKCGPALQKVLIKTKSGKSKSQILPVSYHDGNKEEDIVDDHTHEIDYKHSEMISPNAQARQQAVDRRNFQKMSSTDSQTEDKGQGGDEGGKNVEGDEGNET